MTTLDRPRAAMPAMLRSEWIKLSSIRSNPAILALTVAISFLVSWAVATFVTDEVLFVSEAFLYTTVLTAVVAAVAGILLFSSEAQHGTLAPMLAAQPSRGVVAASKMLMASAFGVVLGVAGLIAGFAGALLSGIAMGDTSTMLASALWAVIFVAVASLLGVGVGMAVRHSSAAISGLLVWWLVVENLVFTFAPQRLSRFLPFVAGNNLLGIDDSDSAFGQSAEIALSRTENALVFGGFAAVALIVGTVLLHRRDAS